MVGNLIDNACKWTTSKVVIHSETVNDKLLILVEDDGPGIQPSQLPRLFAGGAVVGDRRGVGLSVSQFIAQSMGTQITVASVPGYGATFSFNLVTGQEALAGVLGLRLGFGAGTDLAAGLGRGLTSGFGGNGAGCGAGSGLG